MISTFYIIKYKENIVMIIQYGPQAHLIQSSACVIHILYRVTFPLVLSNHVLLTFNF